MLDISHMYSAIHISVQATTNSLASDLTVDSLKTHEIQLVPFSKQKAKRVNPFAISKPRSKPQNGRNEKVTTVRKKTTEHMKI